MPHASPSEPPGQRRAFQLLFGCLLVVGIGNSMLLALLPPLVRRLELPDSSIGWIFSLSALIWTFASPYWGRVSDHTGRKPIIAMGLFAYAVSMTLFGLAVVLGLMGWLHGAALLAALILTRGIFGLFGAATNPAAQAYVADRTSALQRTEELAALMGAFALGSAIGPALCALMVAKTGLVVPILLVAVLALGATFAVLRVLPEAPHDADATPPRQASGGTWRLARDPRVAPYLIYGLGLSAATGITTQVYALFTMDRLGVAGAAGAELAAAGFMVLALAMLVTQLALLPRLALTTRTLMMLGAALIALGVAIQIAAPSLGALLASQLVQGFGFGLARPGFASGASTAVLAHEQGATAGLVVATNGAGYVLSPLAGGVAYEQFGMNAPLYVTIVLMAAMGLFAWRSRRLKAQTAPSTNINVSDL